MSKLYCNTGIIIYNYFYFCNGINDRFQKLLFCRLEKVINKG